MILSAQELPSACVFPQALDNQFVSKDSFDSILGNKLKLRDHRAEINRLVRRELNRSLIYSPGVVINRVSFLSTEPLYQSYAKDAPRDSVRSTAELLKTRALIPMLFGEEEAFTPEELEKRITVGIQEDGLAALNHLFQEHGLAGAAAFKADPTTMKNVPRAYRKYFGTWTAAEPGDINDMGQEVFGSSWRHDFLKGFESDVLTVGKWFSDNRELPQLRREEAYQHFLLRDDLRENVPLGAYGNPQNLQYPFQIKQLLDLRYASNIPDHIGRITFTPDLFPSRTALQDTANQNFREGNDLATLAGNLAQKARELLYRAQQNFVLPNLEDLDFPAIERIRGSQVWEEFIRVQNAILSFGGDAGSFLEATAQLPDAFARLQEHVASVVRLQLRNVRTRKLSPVVKVAISAGAGAVTWQLTGNPNAGMGAAIAAQVLGDTIPDKLHGLAIKLLLQFVDSDGKIDRAMSTSIEAVRSRAEITKNDLRMLLAAAGGNAETPGLLQQTAEMENA